MAPRLRRLIADHQNVTAAFASHPRIRVLQTEGNPPEKYSIEFRVNGLVPDGAESFRPGHKFTVGTLQIETRSTTGHSRGGITYVIHGLPRKIAVVGDSIFAASMGGGAVSYSDAIRNNREQILTLPGDTILCPGHGPLTTVEEQQKHNPFFPSTFR